ncbi:MAG: 2,3-bisphosphoglycerate-independent phosphoglycerate mutase [bacterium]
MTPKTPFKSPRINTPNMLVILDGFGYSSKTNGNAIALANMQTYNKLLQDYPSVLLRAEGQFVGLLPGVIGNSEVGHLTIGAGRVIESVLKRFDDSIENNTFFSNPILTQNLTKLKETGHALHIMGLLSEGGVHSHEKHMHALIKFASKIGLKKVYIHAFLDGRDVAPTHAKANLQKLENICKKYNCGEIASLHGRFYAMDRDSNWARTQETYNLLVGKVKQTEKTNSPTKALTWQAALEDSYAAGITDEFVKPILLGPLNCHPELVSGSNQPGTISSGDGVIFFNFRPDRAQQLAQCFLNPEFKEFPTSCSPLFFITTTRYKHEFKNFNNPVLFEQDDIYHTLLDEICTQKPDAQVFCIAETEKYAHVTYFFKGMREEQLPHETRVLVPSIKAKNYINHPEMSADKITGHILESLNTDPAYFYLVNYANADMVGHSGDLPATILACKSLEKQLEILYQEIIEKHNGTLFITSDHGNAEQMINEQTGKPKTNHTLNPVPFILINKSYKNKHITNFTQLSPTPITQGIAQIAPTILNFLGLNIPKEMLAPLDIIEQK